MNKLSHDELTQALDKLASGLEEMVRDYPDSDLMDAFAGQAEVIEARAADEDLPFFRTRVQCMLRDAGLIPGDEEPCDEG